MQPTQDGAAVAFAQAAAVPQGKGDATRPVQGAQDTQ